MDIDFKLHLELPSGVLYGNGGPKDDARSKDESLFTHSRVNRILF